MQIKFIQYYTSNCQYAIHSEKINKLYCNKYNIEYYALTDDNHITNNNESRAIQWYKIKFTKEILQSNHHDYIVFADADAVFVNHNKDIRDIINLYPNKELIITNDFGPDIVNTGVMIFKNTPWSVNFLERIWDAGNTIARGQFLNNIWHEQSIVSIFMTVNPDDRNRTQILDTNGIDSINDVQNRPSTFIYHDITKSNFAFILNNINSHNILDKIDPDWSSDIVLHKASYGPESFEIDAGYNYPLTMTADVTDIVRSNLNQYNNKQFYIKADNASMGGDPAYGHIKFLNVEFSFINNQDKTYKISTKENNVLYLSFLPNKIVDNARKLFIISSSINTKYGRYDIPTRFQQTLNTIKSIKDKAPGSKILIFELSIDKLTQNQINELNVDYYIDDLPIDGMNDVYNIGAEGIVKNISEVYGTSKILNYIKENNFHLLFDRIFKISGRYELSDNFNMQIYNNLNNCYTFHAEHAYKYYNTRLYSFSTSLLDHYIETFKNVLNDINDLRQNKVHIDIEHSLYKNIDPNLCISLPYVGVKGYQAVDAGFVNE